MKSFLSKDYEIGDRNFGSANLRCSEAEDEAFLRAIMHLSNICRIL
ncbi:hypothetical protein [Nostoc sp.]